MWLNAKVILLEELLTKKEKIEKEELEVFIRLLNASKNQRDRSLVVWVDSVLKPKIREIVKDWVIVESINAV